MTDFALLPHTSQNSCRTLYTYCLVQQARGAGRCAMGQLNSMGHTFKRDNVFIFKEFNKYNGVNNVFSVFSKLFKPLTNLQSVSSVFYDVLPGVFQI